MKVGRVKEKSAYEGATDKSGDTGGTVSIMTKEQDAWSEFITTELKAFEVYEICLIEEEGSWSSSFGKRLRGLTHKIPNSILELLYYVVSF